jgi:hypothetical protein
LKTCLLLEVPRKGLEALDGSPRDGHQQSECDEQRQPEKRGEKLSRPAQQIAEHRRLLECRGPGENLSCGLVLRGSASGRST